MCWWSINIVPLPQRRAQNESATIYCNIKIYRQVFPCHLEDMEKTTENISAKERQSTRNVFLSMFLLSCKSRLSNHTHKHTHTHTHYQHHNPHRNSVQRVEQRWHGVYDRCCRRKVSEKCACVCGTSLKGNFQQKQCGGNMKLLS